MTKAIEIQHATWGWKDNIALRDISGSFMQGSLTAVIGPNGAGKSTLIKGLLRLIKPIKGSVHIAPHLKNELSLLPQAGALDKSFPMTVYDLVALGAWRRIGPWKGYNKQEKEKIEHALACVGIADLADRLIDTLSGGQLQRALFARVIMGDAAVILLDEPFAAVDEPTQMDLMKIIMRWHAQGKTVITVIHDIEVVRQYFPQTLLLAGEVIAWDKTELALSEANIAKVRQIALKGF